MPRKKQLFEYSQNVGENLLDAIKERFDLKDEFLEEFQNAPMLRFYYKQDAVKVRTYVIMFMKHFAFSILRYISDLGSLELPVRPLYTKLDPNDDQIWYFYRYDNQLPPRVIERIDCQYEIYAENDVQAIIDTLEPYINKVYLNRNKNEWMGLSAISNQFGFTPEENLKSEKGNHISYLDLIDGPDAQQFNSSDLFQFWFQMKVRFERWESEAWQVQLFEPYVKELQNEDQNEPILEESFSQRNIDEGNITDQRVEAIQALQSIGIVAKYSIDELLDDYSILKDYKYKMQNEVPFALSSWEQFKGFYMSFYQGNSFFIPVNYAIDENATLAFVKAGGDPNILIIRRAVKNTIQTNKARALSMLQSISSLIITMGFSSVAAYMAGTTYALGLSPMVGTMARFRVAPNFGGVSILAGTVGGESISMLMDFAIEGNDRTWYEYPMKYSAAYGKFVDYQVPKYIEGIVTANMQPDGYARELKNAPKTLNAKLPIWSALKEIDADQNKYARAGNVFFTGKITLERWKDELPFNEKDMVESYEFMNIAAYLEVALGNRSWQVREFTTIKNGVNPAAKRGMRGRL